MGDGESGGRRGRHVCVHIFMHEFFLSLSLSVSLNSLSRARALSLLLLRRVYRSTNTQNPPSSLFLSLTISHLLSRMC